MLLSGPYLGINPNSNRLKEHEESQGTTSKLYSGYLVHIRTMVILVTPLFRDRNVSVRRFDSTEDRLFLPRPTKQYVEVENDFDHQDRRW